jgi:hypothetical protein
MPTGVPSRLERTTRTAPRRVHPPRARAGRVLVRRLAIAFLVPAVLAGCASKKSGAPPVAMPESWDCRVVSGETAAPWVERDSGAWWTEDGSYYVVHTTSQFVTAPGQEAADLRPTRDGAVECTVRQGVARALDLLGARGVELVGAHREELIGQSTRSLLSGDDAVFPRIRLAGAVVESCSLADPPGAGWRAATLVEYPVSFLRGDVNNALHEGRRHEREARVLVSSSKTLFAEGRWFDGLVELARARELAEAAASPDAAALRAETDALLARIIGAVEIEPVGELEVVEIGQRRETVIEFRCRYEWEGRWVDAVGVPIEFEADGFDGILANDPESDSSGTARCTIVAAYGEPGEYAVRAAVDAGVVAAVVGEESAGDAGTGEAVPHAVYLVEGAHAVSVCLELTGLADRDAAQLAAGFDRRMERDGYSVGDCSVDIDVLVRATATVASEESDGSWRAEAKVETEAFDQRTAESVGETAISVAEESGDGQREAEVLALKEAGRLLAAYLTRRILMSDG